MQNETRAESPENLSAQDPDQLARRLADQEGLSQLLQDTADILVLTQDEEGRILSINRYGRWLCNVTEREVLRRPFRDLLTETPPELQQCHGEILRGERHSYRHETPLRQADGSALLFSWWHTAWHISGGRKQRIVSIGLDISDQRIAEEHIGWLSDHDPLTGLFNRRRFIEEGRRWLAQGAGSRGFTLMLLDLDQFRDVNDLNGHHQGDRLLQQVAHALRQQLRESDVIARLGGDEFGILLGSTNPSAVEQAARRCCDALRGMEIRQGGGTHLPVTTSIGITLCPRDGETIEQLLSNADIAMYEAKASGRNAWYIFDGEKPYRERIHERAYWEKQLQRALDADTLEMHFQPIMALASGENTHYEALLRARDDEGNILPPPSLIDCAERNGLIHALDEQVIRQVFSHVSDLRDKKLCLAINLSGLSLQNPRLVDHIRDCLLTYQVAPERIIFEITETAALADIGNAIDTMQALRRIGCRFALDDFGVGFSSLYYLKKLPVDFVKIDGSFIRNLIEEPEHQVLIKALVDVARAFQLQTVAEFVENEQILNALRELGVDYAQGYHIDRPQPFHSIQAA